MKQLTKDLFRSLNKAKETTKQRLKLVIMFTITLTTLLGGLYGMFKMIRIRGLEIVIFIFSVLWVWFGIGLIDMFRDLYKIKN
mgnify:FL=1